MSGRRWYCSRQVAGPLVKECRALRPQFSPTDDAFVIKEKDRLRRSMDSAVCHGAVDRLELMLALFGFEGTHYECSFDNDYLPDSFQGVRKRLTAFFKRCRRWREKQGKARRFDYMYAIEYGSQHCRYHVHMVVRDSDFTPSEVRRLWKYGRVDDFPVLKFEGGYRRLARYFNKEPSDGFFLPVGRHPWSVSRSLRAKLPPLQQWQDSSGAISIPKKALWRSSPAGPECHSNEWGAYYYYSYIKENPNRK